MRNIFAVYALLGLWLLISPWALGISAINTVVANNVALGIVFIFTSLWMFLGRGS
jgi:hypothetical protein